MPQYYKGDPYWLGGDMIVAMDGVKLTSAKQMFRMLRHLKAGEAIPVRIWRDGAYHMVQMTPVALPRL